MAKKGITFCDEMVLAFLRLEKGSTMRIINPQPDILSMHLSLNLDELPKPRYQVGDRIYVKEGYQIKAIHLNIFNGIYLADGKEFNKLLTTCEIQKFSRRKYPHRKTSGRFMYNSLARIFTPPIERISIKRPQDLTIEEMINEGLIYSALIRNKWQELWIQLHGLESWKQNPYCWYPEWDKDKVEVRR